MESLLQFACLLAGLLAVQAQCPPSWQKVDGSCYRVFGQMMPYDRASQICKQFVGCDGISPGHLACPTSYQERRFVRKLRFEVLRPLRGGQMGEGQRLRPQTVWLGFRLGQGSNSSWESTEVYDTAAMAPNWGPNRQAGPAARPRFDPASPRWNGQCATLPGQMQMNGAMQRWGYQRCNQPASFICEISAPGVVNNATFTGADRGFNSTTGMGPQGPQWPNAGGRGAGGRFPTQGGRFPTQGGAGGAGGAGGRFPTQGGAGGAGGRFPNQGGAGGAGGRFPNQGGAGGAGGAGGRFPTQGGAGGAGGAGGRFPTQGGAGGFPNRGNNPQGGNPGWNTPNTPGNTPGNTPQWPSRPNTPGNPPQNPRGNPNPRGPRPRMYQEQGLAQP